MKEDSINQSIFSLLEIIEETNRKIDNKEHKELKGSHVILNLGQVSNIERSNSDDNDRTTSKSIDSKNSKQIGFSSESYKKISRIADSIFELKEFNKYATIDFIEDEIFNWALETFKKKKASEEPFVYLQKRLDDEIKNYTFYLPILGIEIEEEFEVGNVQIRHVDEGFKNKKLQNYLSSFADKNENDFNAEIERLDNKIVTVFSSRGIYNRAKKNSINECNISISALKSFLINDSLNRHTKILDLELKPNIFPYHLIFEETDSSTFDLSYQLASNGEIAPTQIEKDKLEEIFNLGLEEVSAFLKVKTNTEVDILIINLILLSGEYTGIKNLHERVVKIISFFESFFAYTDGKAFGEKNLKKALPKIVSESDVELCKRLIRTHYDIRDKYLHNRFESRIDTNKLFQFQHISTKLIKKLVSLRNSCSTKKELLDYFLE